tara:strand:- start:737 stop:916 length:180 start_codon:yes stop_codon:yes gene_type:complete
MGRHRKYKSLEEQREAQKRWSREYYYRNQKVIQAKARERYRKKKEMEIKEKKVRNFYGD